MASSKRQRELRLAKRKKYKQGRKENYYSSKALTLEEKEELEELEELQKDLQTIQESEVSDDSMDIAYYNNKPVYDATVRRGEIYFFDKSPKVGVEQQGGRPGIIVSNNQSNEHSEFVEVIYTTCQEKTPLPTHVLINSTPKQCTALCEQIHTLSKKKIQNYYGELTSEEMAEVNKALRVNLSLTESTYTEDIEQKEYIKKLEDTIKELNLLLEPAKESIKEVNSTEEITTIGLKIQLDLLTKMYNHLLDRILEREI